MKAHPDVKYMWALLHVPSGTWDHGDANETLYWSEHEARLATMNLPPDTWKPIPVEVRLRKDIREARR